MSRNFAPNNDPTQLNPIAININYEEDCEIFRSFITNFGAEKEGYEAQEDLDVMAEQDHAKSSKYLAILQEISNMNASSITVELDDMLRFDEDNEGIVRRISQNTHHYVELFSKVLDSLMPPSNNDVDMMGMDVIDVIVSHRLARQPEAATGNDEGAPHAAPFDRNSVPASLLRRYDLYFKPSESFSAPLSVRQVSAENVGGLVSVKGIITRISEVRPLLTVATYTCEKCGYEVYQEITSQIFMPLPQCPTEECRRNASKGQLVLQSRGSRFQKHQEARIQELTSQVPMGHIPRSMSVILVGDLARSINPGDHVVLSGIYMPKPYTGFKAIRAGLLTDTFLLTNHINQLKPKYEMAIADDKVKMAIDQLATDPQVYEKLAKSIAPEIFGHDDIKKALVLLMVGASTKEMDDGMKIRGDINICLMGDPGVAKSQLLKYITKIAPRSVYTTGKGSSGVGLTASVSKDPITNEMVLEGGALVLADNGICCIDEFDKMDESDRTAIHEVMEQQTISISKAGITTTLNARTSILAAANPLYGRYNPKKSPRDNINLPPALLSRFDLLFLILDQADNEQDTRLADHICHVHQTGESPNTKIDTIDPDVFRMYIGRAKSLNPIVPQSLVEYLVGAYVGLRQNDLEQKETTYTTPRTLLAVLRLSQALARIRLRELVESVDVDEAMRLMQVSRSSVDLHLSSAAPRKPTDPLTSILNLIRDLSRSGDESNDGVSVDIDVIRSQVKHHGYTDSQLEQCLVAFDQCNVWSVSADGTKLKIFN